MLRRCVGLALVLLALAACDPGTGPARVAFGRDACEQCGMAIGDRRFAAQIRHAGRVHRFDDFGCALLWLESATGGDPAGTEIWVMDQDREQWIDARSASYRPGQRTPMAHGFGAVAAPQEGTLDFRAVQQQIRERERERAGGPADRP
jgi:hypothetical protein